MILHQYNTASYLDTKIHEFWITFKKDMLKLTTQSWAEEDRRGKTYTHWKVMQYQSVLSLLTLIYIDVTKNGTIHTDWSYYNTKYNIDNLRKCLACNCIDLDKALAIFGFPFQTCGSGIECMNIENTFIVEGDSCDDVILPDGLRITEDGQPRVTEDGTNYRIIE